MIIDVDKIGSTLDEQREKLEETYKDKICPLILGCHKRDSEQEMRAIQKKCDKSMFTNAILLKDIPDKKKSPGRIKWNEKFKMVVHDLKKQGYVVCPIFYIHSEINKGGGQGLISEFLESLHVFPELREYSIVIKHKKANFIEQTDRIHPANTYEIRSLRQACKKIIWHLEGHRGHITNHVLNTPVP